MLQLIRENAQGLIMWVIIILVILGLSGFVLSSYTASNIKNYVVKVNDTEITRNEFQRAFNSYQQRLQQSLGENYSRFFNDAMMRETVLNGMIENELMAQLTHEAGFRASANQVYQHIQSNPMFKDENGQFSKDKYNMVIQQYFGFSPEHYESELAKGSAQDQLRSGIRDSAFSLKSDITELERLSSQQRDIGYLRVDRAKVASSISVSDEEIAQYYAANKSAFMTEEQVQVAYLELNLKDIAKQQQVTDEEIKTFYQENLSRYSQAEERKASHILIKLSDTVDAEAAKQKLLEIKKSLAEGKSFADLAKEYSEDRGSALNGGSLDFISKGSSGNQPFEDALFKLKVGEVSEPVQSQFGFHLIKLDEIRPGKTKPLEEVKEKIRQELQNQRAERQFYTDADTLDKQAYEHQDSLEPAAEQLGLEIKLSPFFSRLGGPQIWRNKKVLETAFSHEIMKEGINSELIELADDHMIVLRLKDIKPAEQKSLDQVKEQVRSHLVQEKVKAAIAEKSSELYDKLHNGANPQELAAADKTLEWVNVGYIEREAKKTDNKDEKAPLAADIRKAVFEMSKPTDAAPQLHKMNTVSGDGIIIILRSVRDNPEKSVKEAELEAKQRQFGSVNGQIAERTVIDYLRANSKIDINQEKQDTE